MFIVKIKKTKNDLFKESTKYYFLPKNGTVVCTNRSTLSNRYLNIDRRKNSL